MRGRHIDILQISPADEAYFETYYETFEYLDKSGAPFSAKLEATGSRFGSADHVLICWNYRWDLPLCSRGLRAVTGRGFSGLKSVAIGQVKHV